MKERKYNRKSPHRRREFGRLGKKTKDREFVETLENEFELSPRASDGILSVVREVFFDNREKHEGQMEYTTVRSEEGAGKSMEEMRKVRVILTREAAGDREVQEQYGDSALRKVQILRMTEEAYDQEGLLTEEDLGRILGVSSRTIRRDVAELIEEKVKIYLRGIQRDIGKGISHKVWIVGLYLRQKTYSEIERITGHSVGAIKTYLNDFNRVLMARERGIKSAREIGFYIGRTERLVNEYLGLIETARQDEEQRGRLESIQSQMRHVSGHKSLKKEDFGMVRRQVV